MWNAKIIVTYKPGILDPEAKTIHHALGSLGYDHIHDLTAGRYFELNLDGQLTKAEAETRVNEICEKVLSNPVIQKFSVELGEVKS